MERLDADAPIETARGCEKRTSNPDQQEDQQQATGTRRGFIRRRAAPEEDSIAGSEPGKLAGLDRTTAYTLPGAREISSDYYLMNIYAILAWWNPGN